MARKANRESGKKSPKSLRHSERLGRNVVNKQDARKAIRLRIENLRREISALNWYTDALFVSKKIAEEEAIIAKAQRQIEVYRGYASTAITRLPLAKKELKELLVKLKKESDPREKKREKLLAKLKKLEEEEAEAQKEQEKIQREAGITDSGRAVEDTFIEPMKGY